MGRCREKNDDTKKTKRRQRWKNADAISPCIRGRCTMRVPRIKVSEDMGYKAKTLKDTQSKEPWFTGLPKWKTQLSSRYILCRVVKKTVKPVVGESCRKVGESRWKFGKSRRNPKHFFSKSWFRVHIWTEKNQKTSRQPVFFYLLPYPSIFDQFSRNSRLNDWWLSQCDPTQRNQTFQIEFCRHYIKNADNKKNADEL